MCIYIHMDIYIYIHISCMCVYLSMGQLADFVQLHQSRQRTRYMESVLPTVHGSGRSSAQLPWPLFRPWTSMLVYWLHRCYITTVSLYLPLFTCITGHNWAILKGKCWQIVHQRAAKGRVETRPSCNGIAMGGKPS